MTQPFTFTKTYEAPGKKTFVLSAVIPVACHFRDFGSYVDKASGHRYAKTKHDGLLRVQYTQENAANVNAFLEEVAQVAGVPFQNIVDPKIRMLERDYYYNNNGQEAKHSMMSMEIRWSGSPEYPVQFIDSQLQTVDDTVFLNELAKGYTINASVTVVADKRVQGKVWVNLNAIQLCEPSIYRMTKGGGAGGAANAFAQAGVQAADVQFAPAQSPAQAPAATAQPQPQAQAPFGAPAQAPAQAPAATAQPQANPFGAPAQAPAQTENPFGSPAQAPAQTENPFGAQAPAQAGVAIEDDDIPF